MKGSLAERFWANVKKRKSGCWEWTAGTDSKGYGQLRLKTKGKVVYAHRSSMVLVHRQMADETHSPHLR